MQKTIGSEGGSFRGFTSPIWHEPKSELEQLLLFHVNKATSFGIDGSSSKQRRKRLSISEKQDGIREVGRNAVVF
jgi:hypothetical protein